MEYENQGFDLGAERAQTQQRHYAGSQLGTLDRTDFASIRDRLSGCVKRANDLGMGINTFADQVVGHRPPSPEPAQGMNAVSGPPTLDELVHELEVALARIDTGLNRL